MRSRVRVFVLVGLLVTAIDLALLLVLEAETSLLLANVIALLVAAAVSYLANRVWTFQLNSASRWVAKPWAFGATALLAGIVDTTVLLSLDQYVTELFITKVIAMGAASVVRWAAYRNILFHSIRNTLATRAENPSTPPGDLRLTVVLPAYNEATRIENTLSQISKHLKEAGISGYELLVVDDKSTDDTAEVVERYAASAPESLGLTDTIRVVRHAKNAGKGGAVKTGMLDARGRTVVFTDSDLAYPPSLITDFLAQIEQGWDMVVGNRRHPESKANIEAKLVRKIGGWMVNKLTHVVLLGQFRDTQSGIKGFRSDVAKSMAQRLKTLGFGFDVELFIMAEIDQISLIERPVEVTNRAGSSVSLISDTVKFAQDLVQIRRLAGQGAYELPEPVNPDHEYAQNR